MMAKKGILFGVGVGTGDPELATRKAWRVVGEADVVAYPAPDTIPDRQDGSFSRQIMAEAISPDAIEMPIVVPMIAGAAPAHAVYDAAAARIKTYLDAGLNVAVLCEGDALFYGSFMYVLARLKDEYQVEMVAGVSSLMAAASAAQQPLASRADVLSVVPAPLDDTRLEAAILGAESVAIIKLGRHLARVREVLARLGFLDDALYISHASLPHQQFLPLADAPADAPYFSMILLYKGGALWG